MQQGNVEAINQMLDQGLDFDMSISGTTPLECAMRCLSDPATLNRTLALVSPNMRQRLASHLYFSAAMAGNGIAVECLLNWRMPLESVMHLRSMARPAAASGSQTQ